MTTQRFTGKTVLITGGGAGIGRATALAFAAEGATVVVAGRRAEPLKETVALIEAAGGTATALTADITDGASIQGLVTDTVAHHGSLDIAVNNVGYFPTPAPVGDIDENEWNRALATNVTGTLLSMKHEIAQMRRQGGGVIVNVSSQLGTHKRLPNLGAYVTTKAAVTALTRNAAIDHIGENIRINAVSPGASDTWMSMRAGETEADRAERMKSAVPIGRVGAVEEIAATILFAASPEASFLVGSDLVADGGSTA